MSKKTFAFSCSSQKSLLIPLSLPCGLIWEIALGLTLDCICHSEGFDIFFPAEQTGMIIGVNMFMDLTIFFPLMLTYNNYNLAWNNLVIRICWLGTLKKLHFTIRFDFYHRTLEALFTCTDWQFS